MKTIDEVKEYRPPHMESPIAAIVRDEIKRASDKPNVDDILPRVIERLQKHKKIVTAIRNAESKTGWGYEEYVRASILWFLLWDIYCDFEDKESGGFSCEESST